MATKLDPKTSGRLPARQHGAAAAVALAGGAVPGATKVAFVTLGCPKNQVDSEVMLGHLHRAGFSTTPRLEDAEVAVVNTCAFLEAAVAEGIDTILGVAELKKAGLKGLIVAGCMPQRYSGELLKEIPEIDAVIGTGEVDRIAEVARAVLESRGGDVSFVGDANASYRDPSVRVLSTPRHSPYLQISQGCSNTCTFCIIPTLRGPGRSRRIEELLEEAGRLVRNGARELVTIGQDTTALGLDSDGRPLLGRLLRELDRFQDDGLRWVRLMYTNPLFWDEELIDDFAASRTACPYVDMPVQHAADSVLRRMGRGYTGDHCRWLVRRLRERVPGIALRSTIIVGFPGETDAEFERALDFVAETRFDRLVAFPYFPEKGTAAYRLPRRVDDAVVQERLKRLLDLQKQISREKNRSLVGQTLTVLVEREASGSAAAQGRSHREAPEVDGIIRLTRSTRPRRAVGTNGTSGRGGVESPGRATAEPEARVGHFSEVRITGANAYDLVGELAG